MRSLLVQPSVGLSAGRLEGQVHFLNSQVSSGRGPNLSSSASRQPGPGLTNATVLICRLKFGTFG
jgi:hypothetical protein